MRDAVGEQGWGLKMDLVGGLLWRGRRAAEARVLGVSEEQEWGAAWRAVCP